MIVVTNEEVGDLAVSLKVCHSPHQRITRVHFQPIGGGSRAYSKRTAHVRVSFKPDRALASKVRNAQISGPFRIAAARRNDVPRMSAAAAVREREPGSEAVRTAD